MGALNIRNIGEDRKSALEAEAKAAGLTTAALVRQYIDDGIKRTQASREKAEWLEQAKEGFAYEAERLAQDGPSLAIYRKFPSLEP